MTDTAPTPRTGFVSSTKRLVATVTRGTSARVGSTSPSTWTAADDARTARPDDGWEQIRSTGFTGTGRGGR